MPAQFKRKNIRLPAENYVGKRSYFVTICCQHRHPFLGHPAVAVWVIQALKKFSLRSGFAIHAYCAMPNHLHFLALGLHDASNLLDFVGFFKQHTGFHYEQRKGQRLWQFKFYDHILRRKDGLDDVAAYIWMNPVRKGICADPMAYAFSGSFTMNWKSRAFPLSTWVPPWKQSGTAEHSAALKRGAT